MKDSMSTAIKLNYERDAQLEKRLERWTKAILGNLFFTSDIYADQKEATDFMTFNIHGINGVRVANRIRRFAEFSKNGYKDEFTIRWSRPSGVDTEIHKVRDGKVDYMLYGFANKEETSYIFYHVLDLDVFREHESKPRWVKSNNPPDSELAIWRIDAFPPEFILKKWQSKSLHG